MKKLATLFLAITGAVAVAVSANAAEIKLERPKPQRSEMPNMVMQQHDPAAGITFTSAWRYGNDDTYVFDQALNQITKLHYADVIRAFEFIEYPVSAVPSANLVNFDTTVTGSVSRTSPTNITVTGNSTIGNSVNGCGVSAVQTYTYDPVMAPFKDYSTTYYEAELANSTNDSDCLFIRPSYTGQGDAKPWFTGDPTGPAVYTRVEIAVTKRLEPTASTICTPLSDGQRYQGYFTISMKFDSGTESRNGPLGKLTQVLNRTTRYGLGNAYPEGGTGFSATSTKVCARAEDETTIGNASFSSLSFSLSRPYTYSTRAVSNLPVTGGQRLHLMKTDTAAAAGFTAGGTTTVNSTPSMTWTARAGTLENDATCVATGPDTYNCPDTNTVGNNTYIQELLAKTLADFSRLRVNTNAGVVAFRRANGVMMMFDAPTRDFVPWADVNPLTGSNGPSTPTETPISYLSRIPLSSSSSGGGGAVTFPVISLSADPATVYPGQPFNLTWDVAGASSCEALGSVPNFTGSKTLSGTLPYPSGLASEGTYIAKLTCVHPDGYSKSKEATVTVLPEPPVIVNMSATPTTLVRGGTTRITWDAGTALACTATGTLPGWSGSKGVSGSQDITVSAAGTYTAELSCTRYARSGAATVEIISQPYPPIIFTEFRADPTPVIGGTSTNVNWQTANATACEGRLTPYPSSSTFDSWVGTKTTTGGQGFSTNKIGTFTLILRCTNPDNDQSRQIDVSVTPPSRPTVDVAVSPSSITQGATTTVMFTASGATSCTAGGNVNGWSGSKPATGSSTDLTVTQGAGTYSATVLCSNLGGDTTGSADLTVSPPAGGCTCPSGTNQIDPGHCSNPSDGRVFDCGAMTSPAASITATPTRFYQGQATNLCWTCENAYSTSVAGLPGWGGARPTNSCEVVTVTSTGQYTAQVACGNAVSTAYASTMVEVQTAPNPSIDSFYADAYELDSGANARVYYSTSNATSCTASGMPDWSGPRPGGSSAYYAATPNNGNQTYTLQLVCQNMNGVTTAPATLQVRTWGPPQINGFSVNSPITVGGNVVLNLATSNADHCYLTNGGSALYTSGEVNPNGSSTLGPANSPGSYYEYLYCRNPAGTNSPVVGAPFDVIYPPGAVTSFDVQPREINSGGGVNVSWASANTSSCSGTGSLPSWTAGGNPTPGRPTSGSLGIASIGNEGPAPIPYTASIECSNANGGIAYGREINVTVKPALPRLVTSVSTSTLGGGQTFSFSWDSSGSAKSCLPIGTLPGWQGGASTQSSGTVNVTAPTTDGNYTIGMQCSNDSGSVDSSQTVSVSAACFVYMALAQNPASPSDNWCYYFECGDPGRDPNTNDNKLSIYIASDPTSSYYGAPYNNTAAANQRNIKKTVTVPNGGIGYIISRWSKQHTGSSDYDNWQTKRNEFTCANGALSLKPDPGWKDSSSYDRNAEGKTIDKNDDRYWQKLEDPRAFSEGYCVAQNVTWTSKGNECDGSVGDPYGLLSANGTQSTAQMISPRATGSATFTCTNGEWIQSDRKNAACTVTGDIP